MNQKEFKKAIRIAGAVFGWVNITDNDGAYLQIVKQSVILIASEMEPGDEVEAVLREDGDLYIN